MNLQLCHYPQSGATFLNAADSLGAAEAGELLKRRREARSLTQDQLADLLSVDKSYISKLEGGVYHPGRSKYLPRLASALNLSETDVRSINPAAVFEAPAPDDVRSSNRAQIPVLALAAAGHGTWTEADVLTYIEVEPEIASRPNRVTFQVDGDSMEPTLSDGDFIHVDFGDNNPQDDKIYVVHILTNGIVVKRVREYADGTLRLISDNPRFAPIRPDEAKLIGRVFAVTPKTRRL